MTGQSGRLDHEAGDTAAAPSRIRASAISHGFDNGNVLESITLSVDRGEVLAVIGPSGTGKTTLLRLCALFHPPDEGTIRVGGVDAWSVSERERLTARRRIGMVFQEPNLFDASIRRNVEYGVHVRHGWNERLRRWLSRIRGGTTEPAVGDALEVVGLADERGRHVSELSGGERQRVAFARALACDPDVLLLDEPTSDLDPRNTAVIEDAVGTARSQGLGILVATHDMHQAERIADRVAVLLDGRLIEVGPTDRIFTDPDDPRTRRFIDGELVY